MQVHTFPVGPFQENTYLLVENGQAVVVDPGFFNDSEMNPFRQTLENEGAELKAVLLTHAHVDHALGIRRVLAAWNVPVYLSHKDLFHWENYVSQGALFGFSVEPFDFTPHDISEQSDWQLASLTMDVLHTPGHAPEHMAFYFRQEGVLIAGDTVFREGIGRTDLYMGNFEELERSIRGKIYTLPDDTLLLPGHGPQTTVAHEKQSNMFVRE